MKATMKRAGVMQIQQSPTLIRFLGTHQCFHCGRRHKPDQRIPVTLVLGLTERRSWTSRECWKQAGGFEAIDGLELRVVE